MLQLMLLMANLCVVGDEEWIEVAEFPRYRTCTEWAAAVMREGHEPLHVSSQNGMYFAVFRTKDNEIVFCPHDRRAILQDKVRTLALMDEAGRDLFERGERKRRNLTRQYVIRRPDAELKLHELHGTAFPIVKDAPHRIRIIYKIKSIRGEDSWTPIFDEFVEYSE